MPGLDKDLQHEKKVPFWDQSVQTLQALLVEV